jgi:hypothetical protein
VRFSVWGRSVGGSRDRGSELGILSVPKSTAGGSIIKGGMDGVWCV